MFSRFFIDRPIFAAVLSIFLVLAGLASMRVLPIAQYPEIAPPVVTVRAIYPGASAEVLEQTVAAPLENQINGVESMLYMSSNSSSNGVVEINVTFEIGINVDQAALNVNNRVKQAEARLPQEVRRQGVTVEKNSTSFLQVLAFNSPDGTFDDLYVSNYVTLNVLDIIKRVPGTTNVQIFGAKDYAMRIWLRPDRMTQLKLTTADLLRALNEQNAQFAAGKVGQAPTGGPQELVYTVTTKGRLADPREFEEIIIRSNPDGSALRLKDVARVELASKDYDFIGRVNGRQSALLGIFLQPGANALDVAEDVGKAMAEISKRFPVGMGYQNVYDTTRFVKVSIREVVKTLLEAIVLVFLVMYLFLQNFRATLIPTIAVPVVLLGTFGVLAVFGYSINTLTMFAMVLAIGLLVDDAIVVVENVERVMTVEGLSPREGTRKSMDQITGALVGIALVLSAVFVPMAFFGGSTGVIYRQFSVTIVSAMLLSVLVALVLTPALCATILKPVAKGHGHSERGLMGGFFRGFNRAFERTSSANQSLVGRMLASSKRYLAIYGLIVVAMGVLFLRMPTGFLPDEDQGIIVVQAQLPAGATSERTAEVIRTVERHFLEEQKDAVAEILTVSGYSFAGRGQNGGIAFVKLKDWSVRKKPQLKAKAVAARAMASFAQIRDAMVFAFAPPAVVELGNATGFDLQLQDRAGLGHEKLMQARNQLLGMAAQDPRLAAVRPNGQDDTPEYQLDIDHANAGALGLSQADINNTLAIAWGSAYVNDFIDKGRVKKVFLQGDAPSRMQPEDLGKWYVRNRAGEMVPFSSFASAHWTYGSPRLERYNGMPSAEILGQPAPGYTSGGAMAALEEMAAKLPAGIGYEWTGLSYQERMSGSQAPALYALSLLVVFLCLAALYESWSIPTAVMLVVPLGVIGALMAAGLRGLPNDVYFQVGLLTTIGLSSKNAILIVEFAKEQMAHGKGLIEATIEAVRLRLRPIVMTSLAFVLGVLPLAIAGGAGAGAQNAIGTGVVGGTITATVLAVLFVPVFFVVVRRIFPGKRPVDPEAGHLTFELPEEGR